VVGLLALKVLLNLFSEDLGMNLVMGNLSFSSYSIIHTQGNYSVDKGRSSSNVFGLSDNSGSNNVKSFVASSVSAGHFEVYGEIRYITRKFTQLGNSSIERDISVFFVHIVVSGSRLVSDDDSVGLNVSG
jgi:hypothetical protein